MVPPFLPVLVPPPPVQRTRESLVPLLVPVLVPLPTAPVTHVPEVDEGVGVPVGAPDPSWSSRQ